MNTPCLEKTGGPATLLGAALVHADPAYAAGGPPIVGGPPPHEVTGGGTGAEPAHAELDCVAAAGSDHRELPCVAAGAGAHAVTGGAAEVTEDVNAAACAAELFQVAAGGPTVGANAGGREAVGAEADHGAGAAVTGAAPAFADKSEE